METADELSDFSEVGTEGRTWTDGIDNLLDSFSEHIGQRTTGYNQLTNNFTSPALSSVNNAEMLADVDTSLFSGLINI